MEYTIRTTRTDLDFSKNIQDKKVPLLVLDQKWHHLFTAGRKPAAVAPLEQRLNGLLKEQGRAQQQLRELKKIKSNLMKDIVENMDDAESNNRAISKKMEENRRLIDEVNEKMEECEDILLDIPKHLKETNDLLLLETMKYCYGLMRTNATDMEEIGEWIKEIRIELKKQIIRKQNAELKNREIYSYMHDIFGAEMVDVFDLEYHMDEESKDKEKANKNDG